MQTLQIRNQETVGDRLNLLGNLFFFVSLVVSFFYFLPATGRLLSTKEGNLSNLDVKVSVIIPARNEEKNLPKLLSLLSKSSLKPHEVIVVDDNSSDRTNQIAMGFEGLKVVKLDSDPPFGWVGKSWSIWNGYLNSSGDFLLFLDADVEPGKDLIKRLLMEYIKRGGLISVWPYQRFEKLYEHLSLAFNLLVVYASNNVGFPSKKPAGAFGPVVFTSRAEYEFTGGHEKVKGSILEDIKLGSLYIKKGLNVTNFLGNHSVQFRMYPGGFKELLDGFAKNISSGALALGLVGFVFAFSWLTGIYSSIFSFTLLNWFLLRYATVVFVVYLLAKPTGDYRWYDALLYPLHFLFFIFVFFFSFYKTIFVKKVTWRGRNVSVK